MGRFFLSMVMHAKQQPDSRCRKQCFGMLLRVFFSFFSGGMLIAPSVVILLVVVMFVAFMGVGDVEEC